MSSSLVSSINKEPIVYEMPEEYLYGLKFIQKYERYDDKDTLYYPLDISAKNLIQEDNIEKSILDKKPFFKEVGTKGVTITNTIWTKKSPYLEPYLEKMRDEFQLDDKLSINLALEHYIQSFVDFYNNCYDNGLGLGFSNPGKVRKRAMRNNEKDLVDILCSQEKIAGFSNRGIETLRLEDFKKFLETHNRIYNR